MKDLSTFRINLLFQLSLSAQCVRPIAGIEYVADSSELWVVSSDHSIFTYEMSALYAFPSQNIHNFIIFCISGTIDTKISKILEDKDLSNFEDIPITCDAKSLLVGNQVRVLHPPTELCFTLPA